MGTAEDLQAWVDQQYASQIASLEAWWDSSTHHGCFCGAGARCDTPVDGLDQLCQQHDNDYGAVGMSADAMWTADGFVATRDADYRLASNAASATTDATDYQQNLIWLFTTRYQIADGIIWYRQRLQEIEDAKRRFQEWLLSANTLSPEEAQAQLAQWEGYLEGQGVDRAETAAMVADAGFSPGTGDTQIA